MRFFLNTVKLGLGLLLVMEMLLLGGCDRHELENNAFPLALGIEVEQGEEAEDASNTAYTDSEQTGSVSGQNQQIKRATSQNWQKKYELVETGQDENTSQENAQIGNSQTAYHMYAAYPNLQDKDAKENALASDLFWDDTMENLAEGTTLMSENSSRNVDLNHLKVLILDKAMLDGGERTEALVQFFEEKRDASWNTYVLLSDGGMADLFSGDLQTNSCLGIYLEDILEGWTNLKSGSLITVGDLVSQYYNADETLLIPVVTVDEMRPVVEEFAVVENLKWTSERTMEEVFENTSELKYMVRDQSIRPVYWRV